MMNQMMVPTSQNMYNNYLSAVPQQMDDYRKLMAGYQGMAASGGAGGYSRPSEMNEAFGGYRDFMKTGGFTPQGLQEIRARGISPTRAVYQNAQSNIDRQRALQGGYSPNYTAAQAKMSRDLASGISDANINANAGIAQMVQQGRLAGTQGMGGLSAQDAALALQGQQQANQMRLGALGGASNLYGTTPGMISTFGNQLNNANQNWLQGQQLQNQLGLGMMNAQIGRAGVPSTAQNVLGNIKTGSEIYKNLVMPVG